MYLGYAFHMSRIPIIVVLSLGVWLQSPAQFAPLIGGVINNYAEIISYDLCTNGVLVPDAASFKTGDTILLIQMKGAKIDLSNSESFGNIAQYNSAGRYEINYIRWINKDTIFLLHQMKNDYNFSFGQVQIIRIPFYQKAAITQTLTCLPWNGKTGGVLALIVADTLELNADINVSGLGYAGGNGKNKLIRDLGCNESNYVLPQSSDMAGGKGESFVVVSPQKNAGRGAPASGGGGGDNHNAGGGGGGNGGAGGMGGNQFEGCNNNPFVNGGFGGRAASYSGNVSRIFMGGGGGAGHANNLEGGFNADGGSGGGIIILIAGTLEANGYNITANGADGVVCKLDANNEKFCTEGMGGGGAGGSVLIQSGNFLPGVRVVARGGKGADMTQPGGENHGPGGGGGGGLIYVGSPAPAEGVTYICAGGVNGINTVNGNNPWGASPGENGRILYNLRVNYSDALFKRPDSFKVSGLTNICLNTSTQLYAQGGDTYSWQPVSSLNNAFIANPVATPPETTTYTVVIKNNVCRDSTTLNTKVIVLPAPEIKISKSNDINCKMASAQLQASGAEKYTWLPVAGLTDPSVSNPVATTLTDIVYTVTGTDKNGCSSQASLSLKTDFSEKATLFMPNAFTPNHDGLNDRFGVKFLAPPIEFSFFVCNRLGQIIFYTNNANDSWNGTSNGIEQSAGTFIYYVKAKTACGDVQSKGTVVLIR